MKTTQLTVSGMMCGMCVQHVTQALKGVEGVHLADVDLKLGRATVQHEETPPEALIEALIEAVNEAGYEGRIELM